MTLRPSGRVRRAVTLISAALVLVFIISLPALADESQTVTITMTGASHIGINLTHQQWPLGLVAPNTEYYTNPQDSWCTLTVTGNVEVNTTIIGNDAWWGDDPGAYTWTLSGDGSNGKDVYGLWFCISGDDTRGPLENGYVPITQEAGEFWPYDGTGESLEPGASVQFGLRLLTPTEFTGGRTMETQITIIAVTP